MAELRIPDDLRELYGNAVTWRHTNGRAPRFGSGIVEVLIERIAKLESENAAKDAEREKLRQHNSGLANQLAAANATIERESFLLNRVASISDHPRHSKWVRGLGIEARQLISARANGEAKL